MTTDEVLKTLMAGNDRFRNGKSAHRTYDARALDEIATSQKPIACVLACADSRVTPEVIFDQPLGMIFACRVPGNVASESARWVVEMAVGEFKVPLVLVMGHTGCLAVDRVLHGRAERMADMLKQEILTAVNSEKEKGSDELFDRAVELNARYAAQRLMATCPVLAEAVADGWCRCEAGLYRMRSGECSLLTDR